HGHWPRLKEQCHDQRYQQQAQTLLPGQEPVTPGGFISGVHRIWSEVEAQGAAHDVTNNHLPCTPQLPPDQEIHHHHHQYQKALAPYPHRAVPGGHGLGQGTYDSRGLSGVLATAAAVLLWCVAAAAAAAEHQLDAAVRRGIALLDLYRRGRLDERNAGGRGREVQDGRMEDGRMVETETETETEVE
ncbi:hypothetical protein Vretimale_17207, partial [Volvox reticuliferus]